VLSAAWRIWSAPRRRACSPRPRQLERVGLGEHMFDEAGSLALGQQRILEIARALCADPCLLLLDEPAAGLRLEKQALAELLRKLRAEGMGILLVEHDMDFVMGLVDRVVVMEFGEKIAEGLPEEVQQDPGGARSLSGRGGVMTNPHCWKIRDLCVSYGKVEACTTSASRWARARSSP
jgi:branched-chain amino acid transport system permease protein